MGIGKSEAGSGPGVRTYTYARGGEIDYKRMNKQTTIIRLKEINNWGNYQTVGA